MDSETRQQDAHNPTLPAYADTDGMLRVWCRYCVDWHYHGEGSGHRTAHCRNDASPYKENGYTLHPVGKWEGPKKTPKDVPSLITQTDPDADDARVTYAISQLAMYVERGPYYHEDYNLCWFCNTGLDPGMDVAHQRDAGHDPHCVYLKAWRLFYAREAGGV